LSSNPKITLKKSFKTLIHQSEPHSYSYTSFLTDLKLPTIEFLPPKPSQKSISLSIILTETPSLPHSPSIAEESSPSHSSFLEVAMHDHMEEPLTVEEGGKRKIKRKIKLPSLRYIRRSRRKKMDSVVKI
jgi:hypothetical protein